MVGKARVASTFKLVLLLGVAAAADSRLQGINSIGQVQDILRQENGGRIGFVSQGDYDAVSQQFTGKATGLNGSFVGDPEEPPSKRPLDDVQGYVEVVTASADKLQQWVKDGRLVCGATNGVPGEDKDLKVFGAGVLTTRAFLLGGDGEPSKRQNSSIFFKRALDVAISEFIGDGSYAALVQSVNNNFELDVAGKQVLTCATDADINRYPKLSEIPSDDLLNDILNTGVVSIAELTLGSETTQFGELGNWPKDPNANLRYNGTNYEGFWARYEVEVMKRIADAYRLPNGIEINPMYYPSSQLVLSAVENGTAAASGPYYSLAGSYSLNGTDVPRREVFAQSCVVHGYEPFVFTQAAPSEDDTLTTGAIVGIVIAAAAALLALVFSITLVHKERSGNPMFEPLNPDKAKNGRERSQEMQQRA